MLNDIIMKRIILLTGLIVALFFTDGKAENPDGKEPVAAPAVNVVYLTNETFKKLVFNYEANKEWKYEGTKPAIIDFYADWCAPCRQLSPVVEEIAKEYSGKIVVYKVDTEKERILAQNLGITSLPTLLFIPAKGKPQMAQGALPKVTLVKAINEVLLIK
jgi:thioredoxin